MTQSIQILAASTLYSNDEETDKLERVLHVVDAKREDGTRVHATLLARDPIHALELARNLPERLWLKGESY